MAYPQLKKSRRKLLGAIAAGSGAVVTGKALPDVWIRPIVESVILPVHAQTTEGAPTRLTSNGVITDEFVMTPTNATIFANKDALINIFAPPAQAANGCAVAGQCGAIEFTGGNDGVLEVTNVGVDAFTLDLSNFASGSVGGVPYTIQLNSTRSNGSVQFQGECSGYGVALGTSGTCTPVSGPVDPGPGDCTGVTAKYLNRIIVSYNLNTGDTSARSGMLSTISNHNIESLLFVWDDVDGTENKFRFNGSGNVWFSLDPQGVFDYGPFESTLTALKEDVVGRQPDPNRVFKLRCTIIQCGDRTIGISGLSIVPQ